MRRLPLEVLFVTQYYRPELIGSGPFCAELAEWLVQQGRSVTVLTGLPHYPQSAVFPAYRERPPRRELFNGVIVERLRSWIPRSRRALSRIGGELSFLVHGAVALSMGRPARAGLVLSLCPSILSVALGALARRRTGRHVAIVHDIQSGLARGLGMVGNGRMVGLMRWCERMVLNRVDLVIVLSAEMRRQLRDIGVTKPIHIVPIWVDIGRIRPAPEVKSDPPRVLYSGNLGRKQGLGQVIAMAEVLRDVRPELTVALRGSGSEAEGLAREIEVRGLRNVSLMELLPRGDLSEGLAKGDIHLVPQDPEAAEFAVPSKVFNIMAAARPFVTTAHPGSPLWRLKEESRAFLCVPPGDPKAFASAIARLAGDERLRRQLGENGRRFVERQCAKPKVLGELLTLVDGLYVD